MAAASFVTDGGRGCDFFCFLFLEGCIWQRHGVPSIVISWKRGSPCDLHIQIVLHFWNIFFSSALLIASATANVDGILKTLIELCFLSSISTRFSLSSLCCRGIVLRNIYYNHCCFYFPQSQICSSLLPKGFQFFQHNSRTFGILP